MHQYKNEENALYTKKPNLCILLHEIGTLQTEAKAFVPGTHSRSRYHLRCAGAGGRGALRVLPAPAYTGTTRTRGAAWCRLGPTTCPPRQVITHSREAKQRLHALSGEHRKKVERAIELARVPLPIPHTTRRRHRGVVLFII